MVQYARVAPPQWLTNVSPTVQKSPIWFKPVNDTFVSQHGEPHKSIKVRHGHSLDRILNVLLFRTPMHEDRDGAPYAYAPPVSATDISPLGALAPPPPHGKRDNIYNATNKYHLTGHALEAYKKKHGTDESGLTTFQTDGKNNFTWTGVHSAASGDVDNRLFLKDVKGNFPIKQTSGKWKGYYKPATAAHASGGGAVDPFEVPFAALSASMRRAGVGLGDFGLAINPLNSKSTPFVYADAAGDKSTSVGEFSSKALENLGSPATDQDIMVLVFPGSALSDGIKTDKVSFNLGELVKSLSGYANPQDLLYELMGYDTRFTSMTDTIVPAWKALRSLQYDALVDVFKQYGLGL